MTPRARYEASLSKNGAVIEVIDLDDGGRTVTNDAEAVVADLAERFGLTGKRILYRDSEGQWDELLHDDTRFTGFAVLRDLHAYIRTRDRLKQP